MPNNTDDRALESGDLALHDGNEPEEPEAWIWLYYDERHDAFDAAKAADLLGLTWRLAPHRVETDEVELEQWAVEIFLDHTLPVAANSSISRDVW